MAELRYLVQRIGGASHGTTLETELPLDGARRGRSLSSPPTASGTISTPIARLLGPDGIPIIRKWRTAIFPVEGDTLRGGYIVTDNQWNGQAWDLTLAGFTSYPVGQRFNGEKTYVEADPLDVFRDIWTDLQAQPDGYLGIEVSELTSPVRVGRPARPVEFTTGEGEDVSFEADDQARKLNWWSTLDCGREIDSLATETPFDWMEGHRWDDNATGGIAHYIDLGYPSLGSRQYGPKLVYGENVLTPPQVRDNPDYATDVYVYGAGEGRDRIMGYAGTERTGLRRVKVIEDTTIDSVSQADARAVEHIRSVRDQYILDTVVVERHANADIDALEPGHELQYYAETETVTVDQWVKIVNVEAADAEPDRVTVTVVSGA
jgi:hypothetical protein